MNRRRSCGSGLPVPSRPTFASCVLPLAAPVAQVFNLCAFPVRLGLGATNGRRGCRLGRGPLRKPRPQCSRPRLAEGANRRGFWTSPPDRRLAWPGKPDLIPSATFCPLRRWFVWSVNHNKPAASSRWRGCSTPPTRCSPWVGMRPSRLKPSSSVQAPRSVRSTRGSATVTACSRPCTSGFSNAWGPDRRWPSKRPFVRKRSSAPWRCSSHTCLPSCVSTATRPASSSCTVPPT